MPEFQNWHLELGPNAQQFYEIVHLGYKIDSRLFHTVHFSNEFISTYGRPRIEPLHWRTLTMHEIDISAYGVNPKGDFFHLENNVGYANYAEMCMGKGLRGAQHRNPVIPARIDLDAGWLQLMLYKYRQMKVEDIRSHVGKTKGELSKWEVVTSEEVMKIMRKCFVRGVEAIYSKKAKKFWNEAVFEKFIFLAAEYIDNRPTGELVKGELFISYDEFALSSALGTMSLEEERPEDPGDYVSAEENIAEPETWREQFEREGREQARLEGREVENNEDYDYGEYLDEDGIGEEYEEDMGDGMDDMDCDIKEEGENVEESLMGTLTLIE